MHYSDDTSVLWHLKSLVAQLFVQQIIKANKDTSKLYITGPLWGILLTKGQ